MALKNEAFFSPVLWLILGSVGVVGAFMAMDRAVSSGRPERHMQGVALAILSGTFLLGSVLLHNRRSD